MHTSRLNIYLQYKYFTLKQTTQQLGRGLPTKHVGRRCVGLRVPGLLPTKPAAHGADFPRKKRSGERTHLAGMPSPMKSKQIPTYFSQMEKKDGRVQSAKKDLKMADTTGGARVETDALTKADLQIIVNKIAGLETDLFKKLTDLIQPVRTAYPIELDTPKRL